MGDILASCITEQFGNSYCPQVRLTVTQTGSTNTNVTLTWVLEYVAHGFAFYIGSRAYSVTLAGTTVGSGNFSASGITGTAEIARGTKTINKTTSKQWISFGASFAFNGTWNGVYGGTKSASGSIEVAAKPSYTISYNANGGSGAPSSQTKWYGTNLTLSSSKPTRTGYSFLGWSTSSSATSATYAAGGIYSANASTRLYAVWKANTYTVKYDANGGTGAPANQTKTYGKVLTLSSTKPTKTNYNFKGWGTSASATTVAYDPGASYTANAAITLYAIWELAYTAPRITNPSADRCTSGGTLSEEGTYALVKFSWACDKTVKSIKIEYKLSTATSYTAVAVTATGISGTVNKVIGGSLDTEHMYNVRITVADSVGNSVYATDVPAMAYIIDFLSGGGGVAFGKPAEQKGMDISMDVLLRKGHVFEKEMTDGTVTEMVTGRIRSDDDGRFFGLSLPTGDDGWIRTPTEGIIPYKSGGFGYVGSTAWPFKCGYFKQLMINGRDIYENKILWSGGYYMTAAHTVTLSEAISAQPNGICLVFSSYDKASGSTNNFDFTVFFVPKAQVATHLGAGHTFSMSHVVHSYYSSKYLYFTDTTVKGHDNNNKSGTGVDGVKYDNSKTVLRYVIGV